VQNAVDRAHLGVATGVLAFLRSLGAALGVALLGTVALAYGIPLAREGTAVATQADGAAFSLIFLVAAGLLALSFVMLIVMPEKVLRGSNEQPVMAE
jgi:hypothetical protein